MKIFFTWWNKQTFGTFLKTLFTGKYVGKDNFGNKYYKNKNDQRWVIYANNIEATKISSEWYLWMHRQNMKMLRYSNNCTMNPNYFLVALLVAYSWIVVNSLK